MSGGMSNWSSIRPSGCPMRASRRRVSPKRSGPHSSRSITSGRRRSPGFGPNRSLTWCLSWPTWARSTPKRRRLRAIGYEWRGEFGIAGRRYCTLDDAVTGQRLVQLHAFAAGHPEIDRMLLFRDYLRRPSGTRRAPMRRKRSGAACCTPTTRWPMRRRRPPGSTRAWSRARRAGAMQTRDS